jgi:hypothetical protein
MRPGAHVHEHLDAMFREQLLEVLRGMIGMAHGEDVQTPS